MPMIVAGAGESTIVEALTLVSMVAKTNRIRFTRIAPERYQLGFANHRDAWQGSPFAGSLSDLLTMALEQFSYMLTGF